MPSLTVHRYTRAEIQTNRDRLYVFGDNLARKGFGGQAAAARDEPNAVGIVTKVAPSNENDAFLKDHHYDRWIRENQDAWRRIADALTQNGIVVWPADGLGTGRARLKASSPRIWAELQRKVRQLGGPSFP